MTISAFKEGVFSVVHKHRLEHVQHVYTVYTNMLYQHVVPMGQLWPWTVTLLTLFPSSRGRHPELCNRAPLRIQEWNRVRSQSWGRHQKKQHLSLSGWAGPETQPARSRGLVSGPKASLVRCLLHMWVHGPIKFLGQRPPAMGEYPEHLQWCYPMLPGSGCQISSLSLQESRVDCAAGREFQRANGVSGIITPLW